MNTASQNLPLHLGALQDKLQHPTDYEQAIYYFLDEFAGDQGFLQQSIPKSAPHLLTVLGQVTAKAMGKPAAFDKSHLLHLAQHGFYHGNAAVAGRVALFFYFEAIDTGLLALIPGVTSSMEVARFRLLNGLAHPEKN